MKEIQVTSEQLHNYNTNLTRHIEFLLGASELIENVKIFAISRGGLIPGVYLSNFLNSPLQTINLKRYSDRQGGKIEVLERLPGIESLEGVETIIIADDIVDTGETVNYIKKHFQNLMDLNSVKFGIFVASTIVSKDCPVSVDFIGFESDADWVVFPYEKKDK